MPGMSGETTLAIVRHGESQGNVAKSFGGHGPTPLTERGHAQARATAAALAEFSATAIVSSDLVRARQTAEHIAETTGAPLTTTPGLRERGLGRLDDMTFTDAQAKYPEDWERLISRDPDWRAEGGGESARDAFARVGAAMEGILSEHAGGRVVVVSHAFAIFHAFLHVVGLDPFEATTRLFIQVGNCSITRATHIGQHGVWRLDGLNDTHHLGEL